MSVEQLIRRYARMYGIDPRAALAVARVEGGVRTGAVGDQGTSYGPFQLHRGGALPAGKDAAWANSPAGIEYAIKRMAESGARGLRGRAAVAAIVKNFERPAAPGQEISKAWGLYGNQPSVPGASVDASTSLSPTQTSTGPSFEEQAAKGLRALASGTYSATAGLNALMAVRQSRGSLQSGGGQPGPARFVVQGHNGTPLDTKAVRLAQKYLGTPYVWGGENPGGFDCSGLLQYVWGRQGIKIPRTSQLQWHAGIAVKKGELRPGDAVFFGSPKGPHHVGMYIGNGRFIESPHTGAVVRISKLKGRTDYIGARRFA